MKTDVFLRALDEEVSVMIGDEDKPEITDYVKEKWQNIITLVAELLEVPAGLIMQITKEHMNVFLKSENEDNPYPSDGKDHLLHGLYCETVIGTDKELVVENSLEDEKWKDNPDVQLDMISYYGLPIKWGDGSFFGTICALDSKTNRFSEKYRQLLMFFKNIIEQDLMMLEHNQRLQIISDFDALTNAYNRRKFDQSLEEHFEDYTRYKHPFALVMIDIDSFKNINDSYGHVEGDKVLKHFSELIIKRKRKTDSFARYGGDEFAIITKLTDEENLDTFMSSLQEMIKEDDYLKKYLIEFCYGIKVMDSSIESIEELIDCADKELYLSKQQKNG